MTVSEEWIDEIISMSKSDRVELYNDMQFKLMLLKDHLQSMQYLHRTGLGLDREKLLNVLVRKGLTRNTWVFTDQQIADFVDMSLEICQIDLDYLVNTGWLVRQGQRYTLSQKVKEQK